MGASSNNMDDCAGLGDPAPVRPASDVVDRANETHFWFEADSPLGTVLVTHFREWVSGLCVTKNSTVADADLSDAKWSLVDTDTFVERIRSKIKIRAVEPDPGYDPVFLERVRQALIEGRTDIPIDLMSLKTAPRYRKALQATTRIPRGDTVTYGGIANICGSRGQWVGTAMNRNPVPLLIPCHRVIHSRGEDDEWGYGSNLKKKLLAHERGERVAT